MSRATDAEMGRNIAIFPWFKAAQNLNFWQAVWFLYFQSTLSPGEAILLYAIYDIATTVLEVPSGYLSDRLGRRRTLICAMATMTVATMLLASGETFAAFALAQILLGTSSAFTSGTDSALLYESLAASGREDEIEHHEMIAWRFGFSALALSAVLGGALSLWAGALPFAASALAAGFGFVLCLRFHEPPKRAVHPLAPPVSALVSLRVALSEPVLTWLLWLSVAMYVFSHVPFVFGQPFILQALEGTGLHGETPLVSGAISAAMMVLSVAASWLAPGLRLRLGLPGILLAAFAMQIALCAMLAQSGEALVIVLLLLRMVPDSMSHPFIMARIQPLLGDAARATYLSLQSFVGRLIFAASLFVAARVVGESETMSHGEMQTTLGLYAVAGGVCLVMLALAALRIHIDAPKR